VNFCLVLRQHSAPIDDDARVIEHLAWMRAQHERGTVLISGPSFRQHWYLRVARPITEGRCDGGRRRPTGPRRSGTSRRH
jgi:hypothetical protein